LRTPGKPDTIRRPCNPRIVLNLTEIALFIIPIVLAVTLHEAAHGYVALHFGDDTAKNAGRLTLNPLKHIDPFGTIILPLVLILSNSGFLFGYAKPVPVNFSALRNPRWDMLWVAFAGPLTNIALAVVSTLLLYGVDASVASPSGMVQSIILLSVELNVVLAVFNMLPLPPLDGSKVLAAFLPERAMRPYLAFGRYGMAILLLLLIVFPLVAQRTGLRLDIFAALVQRPANWLVQTLLAITGR
jgi:Zn-dependent protease